MTEKEFNLSEKIFWNEYKHNPQRKYRGKKLLIKDVKEFLRWLKEDEDSYDLNSAEAIQFRNAIQKKRNKLAGDDLK